MPRSRKKSASRKIKRKSPVKFGMIVKPEDYALQRRWKNLKGHFEKSCENCDDEWSVYVKTKNSPVKFNSDRFLWMKDNCSDCADLSCDPYFRGKKMGLSMSALEQYKKDCEKYVKRGEFIRVEEKQ